MATSSQKKSIEYGRAILEKEAQAILSVAESLGESFEQAVSAIADLPQTGRILTTGVGKAGVIALKLSQTLSGVGISSFYLDPTSILHGDLGKFQKDDLVVLLSNSGESSELVRLLPAIKRVGSKLLAITSSINSTLGQHSDITITIGKIPEAGPLGLAPTSSTTAMLAVSDAIVMSVLDQRGFSKEAFAANHPAGALGIKLMLAKERMRTGARHCIAQSTDSLALVNEKIRRTEGRPGAASIIDSSGKLVGVLTDGDILRALAVSNDNLKRPVTDFMGKNPKSVSPNTLIEEAAEIMTHFKIDQVLVVDENKIPVGTLDIQDVTTVS